jgi:hypothetical protein
MRISLRSAAVSAIAAIGLLASSAATATAAPQGYDRCPSGKLCLFDGANGTGTMAAYSSSQPALGSWDNKASSMMNRTGFADLCVYSLPSYQYLDAVHDVVMSTDSHYGMDLAPFHDANSYLANNVSSFRLSDTWHGCLTGREYMNWYSSDVDRPAQPFGDLNGDGQSDLLFRSLKGRLWFERGDGSATLVGGGWNAMTALARHGDLNGDRTEDLLARDTSGILWLYPGNGRGNFGARARVGGGWNSITALVGIGSFNSGTTNDLVARDTSGKLWLYPGNGRGNFGARVLIGTGGWQQFAYLFSVGDTTADGPNDLFGSGGVLKLYEGTSRGTLSSIQDYGYDWDDRELAL